MLGGERCTVNREKGRGLYGEGEIMELDDKRVWGKLM